MAGGPVAGSPMGYGHPNSLYFNPGIYAGYGVGEAMRTLNP